MGFHISWLAVRGKSPDAVRSELALTETEDRSPYAESDVDAVQLPSGWYLVHFNSPGTRERPGKRELSEVSLQRLSQHAEVVTCVIEEGAMVSMASYFHDGSKKWAVVHDSDQGLEHLETEGALPDQFKDIQDRLLAQLKADPDPCDYIFDVPAELAKSIIGFRHDDVRDDKESNPFVKLVRASPAKVASNRPTPGGETATPARKPWWKVW